MFTVENAQSVLAILQSMTDDELGLTLLCCLIVYCICHLVFKLILFSLRKLYLLFADDKKD